jgi:hypothetical protein
VNAKRPMQSEAVGKGEIEYTSTVILNTEARMRPTEEAFIPGRARR